MLAKATAALVRLSGQPSVPVSAPSERLAKYGPVKKTLQNQHFQSSAKLPREQRPR